MKGMIYIGQDFFNSVENLALYLFSYSFVSFALSFIFFWSVPCSVPTHETGWKDKTRTREKSQDCNLQSQPTRGELKLAVNASETVHVSVYRELVVCMFYRHYARLYSLFSRH